MTADLDTMARSAAADLHHRADAVDTEAALAALHRSAGTGRHRVRRLVPSGRALAVAAAAIVLIGALALAVGTRGGDGGSDRLGTATTQPIDPTSYGPLLGTLHGADASELTAEVYGPASLQDGAPLAVAITGGRPGQRYLLTQCAAGSPAFNPAVNCSASAELTVGTDGTSVAEVEAWAVFEGGSIPFPNDCRQARCEMQISHLVEEDQPDDGLPGTAFAPNEPEGDPADAIASVLLPFRADAVAPPIPTMSATYVDRTAEGMHVRLEGRDLAPGRIDIVATGQSEHPTGMLANVLSSARERVESVVVPADGRLSVTVLVPDAITDLSETTVNGVVQDPEIVACGVGTSTCSLWVVPGPSATSGAGTRGTLTPLPAPYPDEPR